MKKLDIFLLKSYAGPFIATFLIALFVLLMQFLWRYIDELVGKGLDTSVIAEFMYLAMVSLIPMALPLAILLASIMTYGNLGEKFELTAIKASGISLQRAMLPLFVVTIIVSIGAFFIASEVIPYANLRFIALKKSIANQRPELNIKPGIFNNDIENFSIRVSSKDPKTNMLYDFVCYDHSNDRGTKGNAVVILADSGKMSVTDDSRYMLVDLYHGVRYDEMDNNPSNVINNKNFPFRKDFFEKQTLLFSLAGFDFNRMDEEMFLNNPQVQPFLKLTSSIDSLSEILNRRITEHTSNLTSHYYLKYANHKERLFADSLRSNRKYKLRHKGSYDQVHLRPTDGLLAEEENLSDVDSNYIIEDSIIKVRIAQNSDSITKYVYSIKPADLQLVVDLDSVYDNFSQADKDRVMSKTKEFSTETQSIVTRYTDDFIARKRTMAKYRNSWHQKFTLSLACLIFFFIGAPLGAIIRKGGFGLPIVVSIIVFLIYYMISMAGMKMSREGVWPSWQGMWLSSFVILPFGIFLTYKATVDSQLFNTDIFKRIFEPVKNFFQKLGKFSDVGDCTDSHPFRSFCQTFAYILGFVSVGLSFSPMKFGAIIMGSIGVVLAVIVILLNKKFKFKSKFAILAIIICIVGVSMSALKYKSKKLKTSEPVKTEQVSPEELQK